MLVCFLFFVMLLFACFLFLILVLLERERKRKREHKREHKVRWVGSWKSWERESGQIYCMIFLRKKKTKISKMYYFVQLKFV